MAEARAGAGRGGHAGPRPAASRRTMYLLYEADVVGQDLAVVLARHRDSPAPGDEPLDPYTVELVEGVDRRRAELDRRIGSASRDWSVERMPLIDRNVLRLGAYELLDRPDVPTAVALNQAVELVKLLSTDDSDRFVNGVLATIAREVR